MSPSQLTRPSDQSCLCQGALDISKSFRAVCQCLKERPTCADCGSGFNDEINKGNIPKMVPIKDVVTDSKNVPLGYLARTMVTLFKKAI